MAKIDKFEFVQLVQCKPVPLVHIVQCFSNGFEGFTRCELCREYENMRKQRKTRQQTASGLVKHFFIIAVKHTEKIRFQCMREFLPITGSNYRTHHARAPAFLPAPVP